MSTARQTYVEPGRRDLNCTRRGLGLGRAPVGGPPQRVPVNLDLLLREVEVAQALALPLFDPLEYAPADAARIMRMQWRMP